MRIGFWPVSAQHLRTSVWYFFVCIGLAIASPAQLATVYSFTGSDGESPVAAVVQGADGNFYGTTYGGGANSKGTVFKVTPGGSLTTLYSFCAQSGCADGSFPTAGLVQGSDGNFYGTTSTGGGGGSCSHGCGSVFKITPSGTLTTLHGFNDSDGQDPVAGLVQGSDGNFYGTTYFGGAESNGTVFKITSGGALTTLYSFGDQGGPGGALPEAGLVQGTDGNFYGTTSKGGTGIHAFGTVFKITPSGTLTTLYSFCHQTGCDDGDTPQAGLVQGADGNFYGTTSEDGPNCGFCGTVFKITPSGTLTTLHAFCSQSNCSDGYHPLAGLIQGSDGNFYGTTENGAAAGTLFEITPSGTLTTLTSFNSSDGANPEAAVVQATDGSFYGTTTSGGARNDGTVFRYQSSATLTVSVAGQGSVTSTDGFINCPGTCTHAYAGGTPVTLHAMPSSDWAFSGWTGACSGVGACNLTMTANLAVTAVFVEPGHGIQFTPVTPCRLVDTRTTNSPIVGGTSQDFAVPQLGGCDIPSSASAYSLNVTVVPHEPLGYLTIWPAGQAQPTVSIMNSLDGRTKANAAIVPAGSDGAVSVFASNTTDLVLDIDGYFTAPGSQTLEFYPLAPCRVIDTRNANGNLGGPSLTGGQPRNFPVTESTCLQGISNPQAYSFNFTVVPTQQDPGQPLGYLTVWPEGGSQPTVSTLNNLTATVVANAAIVPAGTGGGISVFASNNTDLVVDINGYFAAPGTSGLKLYPVAPCRVLDTRQVGSGNPIQGTLAVNVTGSACAPPAAAQAYVFNATVVPSGPLGYLTLWPDGGQQPLASTMNALDGEITSNMAIVPSTNGSIDAFASNPTQLVLDISSYFAP